MPVGPGPSWAGQGGPGQDKARCRHLASSCSAAVVTTGPTAWNRPSVGPSPPPAAARGRAASVRARVAPSAAPWIAGGGCATPASHPRGRRLAVLVVPGTTSRASSLGCFVDTPAEAENHRTRTEAPRRCGRESKGDLKCDSPTFKLPGYQHPSHIIILRAALLSTRNQRIGESSAKPFII